VKYKVHEGFEIFYELATVNLQSDSSN